MFKMIRITYTLIVIICMIASCNSNPSKESDIISSIAADQESPKELSERLKQIEIEEKQLALAEKKNQTSITFEKIVHDFGNIKPNSINTYKFKFENTGKKPLIIDRVTASCGCTTPHKPEEPILPGKSEYITVEFHPKPAQKKHISKTIVVESNTTPRMNELEIKAYID